MPELPEVEIIRHRIAPHVEGKKVLSVKVRKYDLRHPVPAGFEAELPGQWIMKVERRGKYLIFRCCDGNIIMHLGMTGNLHVLPDNIPPQKHDHVDIIFIDGLCLRFNDPRRFGTVTWTKEEPLNHFLFEHLGPEPFVESFTGNYLFTLSRNRNISIKQFIMDSKVVAGLGNIYANEALFRCSTNPERKARSLSKYNYDRLKDAILEVLDSAIKEGVSTITESCLKSETTGYFKVTTNVYGKAGEPCGVCGTPIRKTRHGGRSTYFCPMCQK